MSEEERLDRAIEALLADRSPRALAGELEPEEQRMLRAAQLLRGSKSPAARPEFVERLRGELFPRHRRVSRRTAFLSGVGALAAGLAAGVGLDRMGKSDTNQAAPQQARIRPDWGQWYAVATVAELPEGAIKSFSAGSLEGFVIHHRGQIRALSRVCTHMGCILQPGKGALDCPCHGAQFDLNGRLRSGPGGYGKAGGKVIPPLPQIQVRVRGDKVEVLGA